MAKKQIKKKKKNPVNVNTDQGDTKGQMKKRSKTDRGGQKCFRKRRKRRFTKKKMTVSNGDKRRMEKTKNRRRQKDSEDYNVGPTERQKES